MTKYIQVIKLPNDYTFLTKEHIVSMSGYQNGGTAITSISGRTYFREEPYDAIAQAFCDINDGEVLMIDRFKSEDEHKGSQSWHIKRWAGVEAEYERIVRWAEMSKKMPGLIYFMEDIVPVLAVWLISYVSLLLPFIFVNFLFGLGMSTSTVLLTPFLISSVTLPLTTRKFDLTKFELSEVVKEIFNAPFIGQPLLPEDGESCDS